jgi:hypothetical protein
MKSGKVVLRLEGKSGKEDDFIDLDLNKGI